MQYLIKSAEVQGQLRDSFCGSARRGSAKSQFEAAGAVLARDRPRGLFHNALSMNRAFQLRTREELVPRCRIEYDAARRELINGYAPMATINTRYGYSQPVSDPLDPWITQKLIAELRTEQFDEPDSEHTQVSVGNEHWAVTAHVSGLITFDNIDLLEGEESDLPEEMHLRDIPDDQLIRIWQAVVCGDQDGLLDHPWKRLSELPLYVRDFYRSGA
jgi:hypothetical protein